MPSAVRCEKTIGEDSTDARRSKDVSQSRRLLSLAAVEMEWTGAVAEDRRHGSSDAARWVDRFNASGRRGLIDRPHRRSRASPVGGTVGAVREDRGGGPDREERWRRRWRRVDLKVSSLRGSASNFDPRYVGKLLKKFGSRTSAPVRAIRLQDELDRRGVQKNFRHAESSSATPRTTPVEIWFQDEARIGQKNGLVRQWAATWNGPIQLPTNATTTPICWRDLLGARRGSGAGAALRDTDMIALTSMKSRERRGGAHAVLAGRPRRMAYYRQARHARRITTSCRSRAELNLVENVWQRSSSELDSNTVSKTHRRHRRRRMRRLAKADRIQRKSHPSECADGLTSVSSL